MKSKFLILLLVGVLFYLPTFAQNKGKKTLRAKTDLITDYYRIDWVNANRGKIVIGSKNVSSNAKGRNAKFKSTDIIWWKNDKQAINVHNIKSHEPERLTRAEMAKYGSRSIYDYYVKKHRLESKSANDTNPVLPSIELYMINDTVQIDMDPIDALPKDEDHYFTLKYTKRVKNDYNTISIPLTTIIDGCLYLTKNDLITHGILASVGSLEFSFLEYHVNNNSKTVINNLKINILR